MKHSLMINRFGKNITLTDLTQFNLLLGKNGSGKSQIMQAINFSYHDVLYIQPERGGWLEGSKIVKKEESFDATVHQKIVLLAVDETEEAKNYRPTDEKAIYLIQVRNSIPNYDLELFTESSGYAIDKDFFLERKLEKRCSPSLVRCIDGTIKMWGRTNLNSHGVDAWSFTILNTEKLNELSFPSDDERTGWVSDDQIPQEIFSEIAAKKAHTYQTLFAAWLEEGEPENQQLYEEYQFYISIPQDFMQPHEERMIFDKNAVNQMVAVLNCSHYSEEMLVIDPKTHMNSVTLNQYPNFRRRTITKLQQFVIQNRENTDLLNELVQALNKVVSSITIRINPNFNQEEWDLQGDQSLEEYQYLKQVICFQSKKDNAYIQESGISSGENELIALILAIFIFIKKKDNPLKTNASSLPNELSKLLLLDEPEPHLHPDAQASFIEWLHEFIRNNSSLQHPIATIIATHSTSILGALSIHGDASVCFLPPNVGSSPENQFAFHKINDGLTKIVPIFDAHSLSQIFNRHPILLVEGDDDARIWQQAIRTTKGKLKLSPCVAGSKSAITAAIPSINQISQSIYDNPVAYVLYDRDDVAKDSDVAMPRDGITERLRLYCYAAENLLLTDEVLGWIGKKYNIHLTWDKVYEEIAKWLDTQKNYKDAEELRALEQNRKTIKIKDLRDILVRFIEDTLTHLSGTRVVISESWEMLIGKTIGEIINKKIALSNSEHSIQAYLGKEIWTHLLAKPISESEDHTHHHSNQMSLSKKTSKKATGRPSETVPASKSSASQGTLSKGKELFSKKDKDLFSELFRKKYSFFTQKKIEGDRTILTIQSNPLPDKESHPELDNLQRRFIQIIHNGNNTESWLEEYRRLDRTCVINCNSAFFNQLNGEFEYVKEENGNDGKNACIIS